MKWKRVNYASTRWMARPQLICKLGNVKPKDPGESIRKAVRVSGRKKTRIKYKKTSKSILMLSQNKFN
jgi:hypothetical protein